MTLDIARKLLALKRGELKARTQITQANIPLVLAMAKRCKLAAVDFAELISEGNMALLRSVDKFDCARGFKFSTYACRAILKSFSRVATKTSRYRSRFPVEFDPALEKSDQIQMVRNTLEGDCLTELCKSTFAHDLFELLWPRLGAECQPHLLAERGLGADHRRGCVVQPADWVEGLLELIM